MDAAYKRFYKILDDNLKDTINKNIIIYGCNRGGDFIRWFYKTCYKKEIKTFVDRWELSKETTIPHLWAFYYIYDQNDIIINVTPENIIDEFNDTGEDWNKTLYRQEQIVNLWDKIYKVDDKDEYPQITYFEWLEYTWGIDLTGTIKRKFTAGEESHGYFPTEFRFFVDGLKDFTINESDAVLDIGSGKGSGIFSLLAAGFKKVGGVEYTDYIFRKMDDNLNSVGLSHLNVMAGEMENELDKDIVCYQGDATLMQEQLDQYNWFFLFNPFSWNIMEKVLNNICNSLHEKPRKVHIFYAEPICHQLIINTGMFEVVNMICNDYSEVSYYAYIYESRLD